jgi:hypothetical protein
LQWIVYSESGRKIGHKAKGLLLLANNFGHKPMNIELAQQVFAQEQLCRSGITIMNKLDQ